MTTRNIRLYEMLVRVRDFGAAHRDAFPAAGLDGETFAALAAVVTALTEAAVSEAPGRSTEREHTATRAAARAALRERLDNISRTARALALDTPWAGRGRATEADVQNSISGIFVRGGSLSATSE